MQNNHRSPLPIFRSGTILLNIPKAKTFFTTNVSSVCVCHQSGAVMAVLAAVCTKVPEAKLGIIFLPMVTFSAGSVSGMLAVRE